MTEQSYLPPELGQPSRSEIMPCEPNAAQVPFRKPTFFWVGGLVVAIGFSLFVAVNFLFPKSTWLSVFTLGLAAVGALTIAGEAVAWSGSRAPAIAALQTLYPQIGRQNLGVLTIVHPPFGCDGQEHTRDIGYITIERDLLHWRGGWFQMQIRRDDIGRIESDLTSIGIAIRPGAFADIRRINAKMTTNGHFYISQKPKLESLRLWHGGMRID